MNIILNRTIFLAAILVFFSVYVKAEVDSGGKLGQGKNTCNEYITVVDGNWSHPLNALNFHGYISWAQGMISGYNQHSGKEPLIINTDDLKLTLVDYCRDNSEVSFADAVTSLIP